MKHYLQSLGIISDDEIEDLCEHSSTKHIRKNDFFIRENRVCREVAYIKEGILRSFYTDENGNEITYCIMFQNRLMTAYSSFITGKPTPKNIQAVTDTELIVFQKETCQELAEKSRNWIKLQKYFAEQEYIELEKRMFSYQREDAKQRYKNLMENYPEYIRQIPLQYIASYLGVSPRHLSRIRKQVGN